MPRCRSANMPTSKNADLALASDRMEALLGQLLEFLERRQPREAMEFKAGSDPRTLRDAMGCFATGITIVTALDTEGTPVGLTANSFTSVSLDPPLLLVCIANSAGTAPALREAAHFGVNVLQIGQQPTSNRFARAGKIVSRTSPGRPDKPAYHCSAVRWCRSSASANRCTRRAIISSSSAAWCARSSNRTAILCSISAENTGDCISACNGGQGGIRTHGELAPTAVFKTAALNHSATCPMPAPIARRRAAASETLPVRSAARMSRFVPLRTSQAARICARHRL
jgi:hypothetical protein